MAAYLDPELIDDETTVAEATIAAIGDRLNAALDLAEDEQWEPAEGSPETSIGEAVGIVLATAMTLILDDERNDYAGFGERILGQPRSTAEPADGTSRWTFVEAGTFLVEDGSELVLDAADGTPVGFATVGDVETTVVAPNLFVDIPITALEPGAVGNGLSGPARDYEPLPFVAGVDVLAATTNGTDEQDRDEYIEDIARRTRRLKLVPIITDDYADTALDHPNVARAVAVRHLNLDAPADPPDSPGHVTVFVAGDAGEDLSAAVRDEVAASMMGEDRPLAVTVHVGSPERTNVTIAVALRLATGADEPATVAAVQAAISTAYDPATFGLFEDAPGRWLPPRTTAERTINDYDVTAVIDDVDGVAKIEDVTINGGRSVALAGWAPLPNLTAPATVTVLTS